MASKLLAILFILSISGNAFGAPAASSSIKGEMDESLVFNYENYIRVSALVSLQSPNPLSLALPLPPADAYHSPDQSGDTRDTAGQYQSTFSRPAGLVHHEEHLFILTHQVFELWFKQILHDLESIADIFLMHTTNDTHRSLLAHNYQSKDTDAERFRILHSSAAIGNISVATSSLPFLANYHGIGNADTAPVKATDKNDNGIEWTLSTGAADIIAKRLLRCEEAMRYATGAFKILETMHPSDYLAFREHLGTGSGFQSLQMRHLEILLGLRPQNRIGHSTYREQFTPRQQQLLHQWEAAPSLHDLVTSWLRTIRVPTQFIQELRDRVSTPEDYPFDDPTDPRWAALYVLTYRMEYVRFPQFAAYARVMDAITGMEEAMLLWRSTHPRMVERMIGTRTGTGGSSGVGYLDRTREYRIFKELWWLRTAAIHPMPSLDDLLARSAVDGGSKQQRTIDALRDAGATI